MIIDRDPKLGFVYVCYICRQPTKLPPTFARKEGVVDRSHILMAVCVNCCLDDEFSDNKVRVPTEQCAEGVQLLAACVTEKRI